AFGAEALETIGTEHGEDDELPAARAGQHRAEEDEHQRERRHDEAAQRLSSAVAERERQRQPDAASERQLVRVLEDAEVTDASAADRGRAQKPDVLASVFRAWFDFADVAAPDRVAGTTVRPPRGRLATRGLIDDDAS